MLYLGLGMSFLSPKVTQRWLALLAFAPCLIIITIGAVARPQTGKAAEGYDITEMRRSGAPPLPTQPLVTVNRDIAPILYHSCAQCHRPGEATTIPALTYIHAKSHPPPHP